MNADNYTTGDKIAVRPQLRGGESCSRKGNEAFYALGIELKSLGMSTEDIEQTLKLEANFGRSPAERMSQIASIMKSLMRNGRAA